MCLMENENVLKVNGADEVELLDVYLDEVKHPIAFAAKKQELIDSGMTEEEAVDFIRTTPFQMELYYAPFNGLFLIESEALESIAPFNPYTGEEIPNPHL